MLVELHSCPTINQKPPKQCGGIDGAWRRWREEKTQQPPPPSPGQQSGTVYLSCPPKNSLISNGLIQSLHYGLRMFSLMAFQPYSICRDYKMSFFLFPPPPPPLHQESEKKKGGGWGGRLEIENVRDLWCRYLMASAAADDNRLRDLVGGMMTGNESVRASSKSQFKQSRERQWKTLGRAASRPSLQRSKESTKPPCSPTSHQSAEGVRKYLQPFNF